MNRIETCNNGDGDNYVPMTNAAGANVMLSDEPEPLPDSVVLTDGPHGHAFQRHGDGLWYPVKGTRGRTWDEMLSNRNLVLVYDAEPR